MGGYAFAKNNQFVSFAVLIIVENSASEGVKADFEND